MWAPRELRIAALGCAAVLLVGDAVAYGYTQFGNFGWTRAGFIWFARHLYRTGDAFWLVPIALLMLAVGIVRLPVSRARSLAETVIGHPRATAAAAAVAVLAAAIAGYYVAFHGYAATLDENLANFDAAIFRAGHLMGPVPQGWRPFATALMPRFVMDVPDGAAYISTYLPVNAMLRAVVGLLIDPAWTSPLLAGGAVILVFAIGRRLWPAHPAAAAVSAVVLASSSQLVVTAMTSYAMTAHLALNLLWLWLFLRDDRIGHAGALGTGFFAAGIHQLAFHPLFVAPFVLRLWEARRWRLALYYTLGYALICLFWMDYWQLLLDWEHLRAPWHAGAGVTFFALRALAGLGHLGWGSFGLMLLNLLRLAAWQNPLLLPLACVGCGAWRKQQGIARELAAGIIYTTLVMLVIMPDQGPGWGYRYLHGCLGSLALLAGYGWIALSERANRDETAVLHSVLAVAVAAAVVLLPVHAEQAHEYVMPFVRAHEAIMRAPTDLVIADKTGLLDIETLIRNDPRLLNRPKVLDLSDLTSADLAYLCRHYSISLFDATQALPLGIPTADEHRADFPALRRGRAALARLKCGHELPAPASANR